jgi:hypothetical protein
MPGSGMDPELRAPVTVAPANMFAGRFCLLAKTISGIPAWCWRDIVSIPKAQAPPPVRAGREGVLAQGNLQSNPRRADAS